MLSLVAYDLICLIVLAAGKSTRFEGNKLLSKIGGLTVIERVVRNALDSKADKVVVVVGYEADKVKQALSGMDCEFVYNEDFEKGQSSSVKKGVGFVMRYAEAVMMLPSDMPLITSNSIDAVIEEYKRTKEPLVVAAHQGKSGHPILFDKKFIGEIMEIQEETQGLKAIVNKYRQLIRKVEVGSNEVLIDIDTNEDFKRCLSYFERKVFS